jgi:hypothetical protein
MTDRLMPSDNEGSQTSIDSAVHCPNVLDSSAYPSQDDIKKKLSIQKELSVGVCYNQCTWVSASLNGSMHINANMIEGQAVSYHKIWTNFNIK